MKMKMKMKRIFLSIFILFFFLVGCGGGSQEGGGSREKKKGLADISRDIDLDIKLTKTTGSLGEDIYKAEKVVLRPLTEIACDLEEVLIYPIGKIAKKTFILLDRQADLLVEFINARTIPSPLISNEIDREAESLKEEIDKIISENQDIHGDDLLLLNGFRKEADFFQEIIKKSYTVGVSLMCERLEIERRNLRDIILSDK